VKKFIASLILACTFIVAQAQDGYSISNYDVNILVNKDASLDITENISVHFDISSHGIYRMIPYKYKLNKLPAGQEKADRQLEAGGYTRLIIENINVRGWDFTTRKTNGYQEIKIGSSDKMVDGDQEYTISYRVLNAINFFKDRSEFYFNLIGDQWNVPINKVNFKVQLYTPLSQAPAYFIATGVIGSQENHTTSTWSYNQTLTGNTTEPLTNFQGVTLGNSFPKDYLIKQDYTIRGIKWLWMIPIVFFCMLYIWKRWGKDDPVTITTEFYPPKDVSPSICGYVIDDSLDKRDLTALVPYWGANGYIKVSEKGKDFEFTKVKDLPDTAMSFEKTMFDGIFGFGNPVLLSALKNSFYTTMNSAKSQLEAEVDKRHYYEKGSRGLAAFFVLLGLVLLVYGGYRLIAYWGDEPYWFPIAMMASGIITMIFGSKMAKKTSEGNELYVKLAGFKEFITKVEKARLELFLKQDPNYFDTVLPFAIVFDVADKWKDKLKDLDIPPPTWYAGNYAGFNTYMFMNSLDNSMNKMSESFYSTPPSSSGGSSGGSWGGGGGFSGGGFGGGGGGRW